MKTAGPTISTQALILKKIPFGERDLILHLLTRDQGRIAAFARGALGSRRRFGSSLDWINHLDIDLKASRREGGMASLLAASVRDGFPAVRRDLTRMTLAQSLLEILSLMTVGSETDAGLFASLADGLVHLDRAGEPWPGTCKTILHLIAQLGFKPLLAGCGHCGRSLQDEVDYAIDQQIRLIGSCCVLERDHPYVATGRLWRFLLTDDFPAVWGLQDGPRLYAALSHLVTQLTGAPLKTFQFLTKHLGDPTDKGLVTESL